MNGAHWPPYLQSFGPLTLMVLTQQALYVDSTTQHSHTQNIHRLCQSADERHYHRCMPRQNTCPADFPPLILTQIEQLAQHIVATRKARGETQTQWADKLGISQPTMARLERGDPAIATATYVMCLWLVNPQLNLLQLVQVQPNTATLPAADIAARATAPALPPASAAEEFAQLLAQWPSFQP